MKKYIIIAMVLLSACDGKEPIRTDSTNNTDINVSLLFEYDGCNIYRFMDGRYHYFVRCNNKQSVLETHRKSCGKKCKTTFENEIETFEDF